jgi:hypothetical protein
MRALNEGYRDARRCDRDDPRPAGLASSQRTISTLGKPCFSLAIPTSVTFVSRRCSSERFASPFRYAESQIAMPETRGRRRAWEPLSGVGDPSIHSFETDDARNPFDLDRSSRHFAVRRHSGRREQ